MTSLSPPVQTFMQEAYEVLEALESRLLELEGDPGNPGLIDAVFRNLHTLKGSGEMFGFSALARFTHRFENAYDAVRSGKARVSDRLIDISLRSRDHIERLIGAGADETENDRLASDPTGLALIAEIEALLGGPCDAAPPGDPEPATGAAVETLWTLAFRPEADALRNGLRPDLLVEELASLGDAQVAPRADRVPPLEEIDPTACYLSWEGLLRTSAGRDRIEDVFLFADEGALVLDQAERPEAADEQEERGPAAPPSAPPTTRQSGPASQPTVPATEPTKAPKRSESVRVPSHRLDALMDQLGELVIAQARLDGIARDLADPALIGTAEEIERLITGLRDATLSIRMLQIGTVFGKFRRVVRDLSAELGKDVRLVTSGEETELDKNVIDSLSEPLVHIVRNSVDHGIEPAEVRQETGKPATATVTMSALQSGGEVLVTVSDDGGGLKTERIRDRAVERGLIAADDDLSEHQLHQLIFAPGFSTAQTLSSVSGRGVGMDAVRTVIADLGGSVEVASTLGVGTDITLRLPLTLAIIEGLLVRLAGQAFVVPLAAVDECVELKPEESARNGRAILTIRDELVPFIDLEARFGFEPIARDATRRVVIVRTASRRVGLVVDEIVGQHQTVIKSLSPYHRSIPGLAGGTILGDGSVAIILDPAALVRSTAHLAMEAA